MRLVCFFRGCCVLMVAFQQIESEEAMDAGMPSIRLFGVTDVLPPSLNISLTVYRRETV